MEHSVAYTLADRLANPSRHDNDESEYNEEEEEHPGEAAAAEESGFEESHGDERPTADQTKNNKNKVEIPSSKALGVMNEYLMAPVVARAPQKRNEVLYAEFLDMGRRAGNMYVYCRHCLNAYHDDMARYKQAVQDHKEKYPLEGEGGDETLLLAQKPADPFFCRKRPKNCRNHLQHCTNYQRYRVAHGMEEGGVPGESGTVLPPAGVVQPPDDNEQDEEEHTASPHKDRKRKSQVEVPESLTASLLFAKKYKSHRTSSNSNNHKKGSTKGTYKKLQSPLSFRSGIANNNNTIPVRLQELEETMGAAPEHTNPNIIERITFLEHNYGLDGMGLRLMERLEQLEQL